MYHLIPIKVEFPGYVMKAIAQLLQWIINDVIRGLNKTNFKNMMEFPFWAN